MTARGSENAVLSAIQQQLRQSDREFVPLPDTPTRTISSDDIVGLFAAQVELVDAQCVIVQNVDEARKQVVALCNSGDVRKMCRSDGEIVHEVVKDMPTNVTVVDAVEDREQLFVADAGITEAQWGIAETGTLVLASGAERHRLTSLVPPIHIALVPASRIVATMPSVLNQLTGSDGRHQAVTFITGPSRTADIELTLVVGVHGPKELHVIVLRDI